MELDLNLRVRVHELEAFLEKKVRALHMPLPRGKHASRLPRLLFGAGLRLVALPCHWDTQRAQ
jgi:hypothetical protein